MNATSNVQAATSMGSMGMALAAAGISPDSIIANAEAAVPKKAKPSAAKKAAPKAPTKPKAKKSVTPKVATAEVSAPAEIPATLAEAPYAELNAKAQEFDTVQAALGGYAGQGFDLTEDISVRTEIFDFDRVKLVVTEGQLKGVFVTAREILGCQVLPFIPNLSTEMYQKKVKAHRELRAIAVREGLTEDRHQLEGAEGIRAIRAKRLGRYLIGNLNDRAVVLLTENEKKELVFKLVFYTGRDEVLRQAGHPANKAKPTAPFALVAAGGRTSEKLPQAVNTLIEFLFHYCS